MIRRIARTRRVAMLVAAGLVVAAVPVGVVAGVALASRVAHPLAGSLQVFETPQDLSDRAAATTIARPDGRRTTARMLEQGPLWAAFAFRTRDGAVCLQVLNGGADDAACAPLARFVLDGIRVGIAYRPGDGSLITADLDWGPQGGLRVTQTSQ